MVTRNFFFPPSLSLLALPSRRFHVFASSFAETFLSAISDLAHERDSILCCRWTGRQSSRQREPAFKIVCDVTTLYKIRILGGRRYCQLPILRFLPHFHPFLSLVLLGAIIAPSLCDWSNFASPFSIIVIPSFFIIIIIYSIYLRWMAKWNACHSSPLKLLTRPPRLWKPGYQPVERTGKRTSLTELTLVKAGSFETCHRRMVWKIAFRNTELKSSDAWIDTFANDFGHRFRGFANKAGLRYCITAEIFARNCAMKFFWRRNRREENKKEILFDKVLRN